MFKRNALKVYRKAIRLEQDYGSGMADRVILGRIWYKIFTQQRIKVILKTHKKSKPNRILFDSAPDFSGNARALYDYMIAHGYNKKYKITWIVEEPKEFKRYKAGNVHFIRRVDSGSRFRTAKSYKAALDARIVFFTKFFNFLETKSAGQSCVNVQTGCRWNRITEKEKELLQFDYCIVPGQAFVKPRAKELSCSSKRILPIGEARYQQFYSSRKEAEEYFQKLLGPNTHFKTIFWMPLYRNAVVQTAYKTGAASMMGLPLIHSVADMTVLNEMCKRTDIQLLIYCNPDMETLRKETGELSNISFVTEDALKEAEVQVYELLPKTDALLSDYAAAAIGFLLLDRPIGYILEDFEDYKDANGFLFQDPLEYMPGEHIYQLKELEQFFLHVADGTDTFKQERTKVREKTHNETEDYCKRILDQFEIY